MAVIPGGIENAHDLIAFFAPTLFCIFGNLFLPATMNDSGSGRNKSQKEQKRLRSQCDQLNGDIPWNNCRVHQPMSALIPDNYAAPGYCSVATVPLTVDQIERIQQIISPFWEPRSFDGPQRAANIVLHADRGITMLPERALVGKGMRCLLLVDEVALVEYAGERKGKFVKKDAVRFEAMVAGAGAMGFLGDAGIDVENVRKVFLLGVDGTICLKKTLPRLHGNNIVVMRCPFHTEETDERVPAVKP